MVEGERSCLWIKGPNDDDQSEDEQAQSQIRDKRVESLVNYSGSNSIKEQ